MESGSQIETAEATGAEPSEVRIILTNSPWLRIGGFICGGLSLLWALIILVPTLSLLGRPTAPALESLFCPIIPGAILACVSINLLWRFYLIETSLEAGEIVVRGLIRTDRIRVANLSAVEWRRLSTLVCFHERVADEHFENYSYNVEAKPKLKLDNFDRSSQATLILWLRDRTGHVHHNQWASFCWRYVRPKFLSDRQHLLTRPGTEQVDEQTRRWRRALVTVSLAALLPSIIGWWRGIEGPALFVPVAASLTLALLAGGLAAWKSLLTEICSRWLSTPTALPGLFALGNFVFVAYAIILGHVLLVRTNGFFDTYHRGAAVFAISAITLEIIVAASLVGESRNVERTLGRPRAELIERCLRERYGDDAA
ncbi:hypothetical protein [Stratiformator vulcanicus]|uniref:Uncharacterized protein n=1 Tax=Stratiformator vulcanicus TaxID=2527980 RepID=A0A517QZB9_9PLAN|nr:hypothetical protein [Stratiformator vulcanicus]QDT36989.1 hypothetical protein Pan189_13530 [Stratiformator vulcanicus]